MLCLFWQYNDQKTKRTNKIHAGGRIITLSVDSLSIPQPHHADLVFRVSSEKNIISTADTLGATISVAGRLSAEDLVELLRHLDEGDALF